MGRLPRCTGGCQPSPSILRTPMATCLSSSQCCPTNHDLRLVPYYGKTGIELLRARILNRGRLAGWPILAGSARVGLFTIGPESEITLPNCLDLLEIPDGTVFRDEGASFIKRSGGD